MRAHAPAMPKNYRAVPKFPALVVPAKVLPMREPDPIHATNKAADLPLPSSPLRQDERVALAEVIALENGFVVSAVAAKKPEDIQGVRISFEDAECVLALAVGYCDALRIQEVPQGLSDAEIQARAFKLSEDNDRDVLKVAKLQPMAAGRDLSLSDQQQVCLRAIQIAGERLSNKPTEATRKSLSEVIAVLPQIAEMEQLPKPGLGNVFGIIGMLALLMVACGLLFGPDVYAFLAN